MKEKPNKKQLWLDLKAYHFDALVPEHMWDHVTAFFGGEDAATKAFAHKLSHKLNWETDFALRAIHEYKKFVYLGIISDFHVTPPKVIDQVWHEHILFTQGYRDFCENVIHYDFDHHPELLPHEEQTKKFRTQYRDTITLYQKEFNIDAPNEIWGNTKFGKGHKFIPHKKKRVATSDTSFYDDNMPLYLMFDFSSGSSDSGFSSDFGGFGGGDTGGGGAGGSWSDGGDSNDSGGSDSGGDSGGCSSGCSGCGGGD